MLVDLDMDPYNVIITGVGGQGNVVASQILGHMLVLKGYKVTIGETYGVTQRGGSVMSHLRISKQEQHSPLIPEGQCHLVIGLEPSEGLRVLGHYGNRNVDVLVNTRPIYPLDVIAGNSAYPKVSLILEKIQNLSRKVWTLNAAEIALELGNPIFTNIVMLGAVQSLKILPVDQETFENTIRELLPAKHFDSNLQAFQQGSQVLEGLPLKPSNI